MRNRIANVLFLIAAFSFLMVCDAWAEGESALPLAQYEARLLSADQNSPVSGLTWREVPRAKLSIPISISGNKDEPEGFLFRLVPLIELHNAHGDQSLHDAIPNQLWRGRITLEGTWRWLRPEESLIAFTFGLEHESDHQSIPYLVRPITAVVLNDLLFRGDWTKIFGGFAATVSLSDRFHLLTCTVDAPECGDGNEGSISDELGVEMIGEWGAGDTSPHVRPYGSLSYSYLFGSDMVLQEQRISVQSGIRYRYRYGIWQLFAQFFAGNDVGIQRNTTVVQGGLGFSWSL